MSIQVICFDLDDTLWPCAPVIQRAEQTLYDWLATHYPRITQQFSLEALRQLRRKLHQLYPQLTYHLTAVRKMSLAIAAEQAGYDAQLIEPAFNIFHRARNQVTFYADVLASLEILHQHYRLGSLTNGNADLAQVGIKHLFHFTLSPLDTGVKKPHPTFFEMACQCAKVAPECIVYVGDDPICDIAGALTVGMRAVWLNRDGQIWTESYMPDAVITSLTELETLLNYWN